MNTQGVPDNARPYTFSFACSDETNDIVSSDMIGIDIPITFRATQIHGVLESKLEAVNLYCLKIMCHLKL